MKKMVDPLGLEPKTRQGADPCQITAWHAESLGCPGHRLGPDQPIEFIPRNHVPVPLIAQLDFTALGS